ncbi:MAG: hypothetical protein IKV32_06680 [Muribaculaceae bacterium]|nr:hypothetical protein [Muribaculaceae bacterium]
MLNKFFILTFIAISYNISAYAISIDEFIAKCDSILESPAIKLSGDSVPELKKEKVEKLMLYKADSISNETKNAITMALNSISQTDDMLVVKYSNIDDGDAHVYIQPNDDNLKLFVAHISDEHCYVVYLIGDIELLNKENLININGKDVIKDALKDKELNQELTE